MKHYLPLLTAIISLCLVAPPITNDQFNQGMQQGSADKGQGASTIQGFKSAEVTPDYTDSPAESGYCGGVMLSGMDMTSPGSTALNMSEARKTITESILSMPPDDKSSLNTPLISEGLAMRDKTEAIIDGGFDGCVDQPASFTEITAHQCLRDTKIEQYCACTVTTTRDWKNTEIYRYVTISSGQFRYDQNGKQLVFSVISPVTDVMVNTQLKVYSGFYLLSSRYTFVSPVFNVEAVPGATDTFTLSGASGLNTIEGQVLTSSGCTADGNCIGSDNGDWQVYQSSASGKLTFTLTMYVRVSEKEWVPWVKQSESCPFSRTEGAMTGSQCTEPGETRTVVVGGKTYSIHRDCWKWQDTHLIQTKTEGTRGEFIGNPACMVTHSECADTADSFCASQQVTCSYECKKESNDQICNGEFFYKDDSRAQAQAGTNNMFGQAVSAPAAVAAAGEDTVAPNGVDVRAFTGEAQYYKKVAMGFNNCYKNSGWGRDVSLSNRSSEEKALGRAKDKKLTVYVGEYCSEKVLGVHLERKRGYCMFDSKLVRIVREQRRHDQLGVGFGKGKSPDCRGITVDELQRLDFGVMNFSDFYDDLNAGSEISEDQVLLKKAQNIIAEKMQENASRDVLPMRQP